MRAVRYDRYGAADVAKVVDAPAPSREAGTYLVRVHAAALNPKDVLVRKGKFRWLAGLQFPKAMGYDWAGEIVEGDEAFTPGTRVFGMIQSWKAGAFAELCRVRPDECARAPRGLSYEEAAALPLASLTALQALRDEANVGPGHRVLLHGASGGVGVFAIQLAKALGAHVVTTSSERNRGLCADLGADETLDYATVDFRSASSAGQFDTFFDIFGNQSFTKVRGILSPAGTYVSTVPTPRVLVDALLTPLRTRRRARLVVVRSNRADLELLCRFVDDKDLLPVIEATFPLAEIAEACRRVESKRARGKIVLRVVTGSPIDSSWGLRDD
jgi:NADPH:quinone reductase-like Zn-dependent oxidoreductase